MASHRPAKLTSMVPKKIYVAVLFGGRSSEHEISVRSAASIIAALDRGRYEAIPVAIERSGRWLGPDRSAALLPREVAETCRLDRVEISPEPGCSRGFDVVFPALHGPYGEDGRVQGLLDMADVPYVGSGVLGSACGMDKDVMKRLFHERRLPSLRHVALQRDEAGDRFDDIEERIGYPAFVKPANLGSSVGIRKVEGRADLLRALDYAGEFDRKIIVEPAVHAREIECAVLGNDAPEASLPGEVVVRSGFYDYETKYLTDDAELAVPARLEADQAKSIQGLAVDAFRAVECSGLARVDFFVENATGRILINEVNTMPGFTSISMFPRMWEASGLPYSELIERLIELAFSRQEQNRKVRFEPG